MLRAPPKATRPYTLLPYTTLVRAIPNSMTTNDRIRVPAGIPYTVANEFAGRFCYYGINAILSVDLVNFLHFGDAQATSWQSLFKSAAYFFPLVGAIVRSEEHTSELQSLMRISYAVFCLKKKITTNDNTNYRIINLHSSCVN